VNQNKNYQLITRKEKYEGVFNFILFLENLHTKRMITVLKSSDFSQQNKKSLYLLRFCSTGHKFLMFEDTE